MPALTAGAARAGVAGRMEGNVRARRVYAARGFREVGSYRFMVGDREDRDLIYRRD